MCSAWKSTRIRKYESKEAFPGQIGQLVDDVPEAKMEETGRC